MMSLHTAHLVDNAGFYVWDKVKNTLHGADGGPFPYKSKAAAKSVAARKNGRLTRTRRFAVVTWIRNKEV